jgi:RNA polymerase sigma factor (sigma-70 family)
MPKTEKGKQERSETSDGRARDRVQLVAKIFDQYGDLIRAIIQFNLSDQRNADDVFQDSFLSLLHKPVPEGTQNVKAYLYRAVTNDIIDAARRTRSYRARVCRYAECHKYSVIYEDPQNSVIQAEERREMLRLIERQLPPREAEAVIERFGRDNNIDEAAKRMRVNKRTFSRYLCTGLKRIRRFLKNNGHVDDSS